MTEETKRKISLALKGRKLSQDHREHISIARRGVSLSAETRTRISINRRGKNLGNTNGLGRNLGNKNAYGKTRRERNGNWNGGVSLPDYRERLAGRPRPSACEICLTEARLDFDHDHATGLFRGWLCRRCNLVLGMVKDNTALLAALVTYLENVQPH